MRHSTKQSVAFFGLLFWLIAPVAYSQDPPPSLVQMVTELQSHPDDIALREKIIKLAQEMKPSPVIPEEAREHYVMAETFVEKAKDNSSYERAIEQYKAALLAAPWWADAYRKQAIVQKTAAHYDDAIASLNLYILTQPADTRDAKDEIYKLKALKQSAGEDALKQQREAQQRDAPKALLRQLKAQYNGASYSFSMCSHAPQSVCFSEVGKFPCGCNDAEFHGQYWYDRDSLYNVSFPEDGTILFIIFSMNRQLLMLRGTPKGPTINDIVWEINKNSGNPDVPPKWEPVWIDLLDGLDRLVYSPEGYNGGPARPKDNSLYSTNLRYGYNLLKKK
jgi:tetratricopeptide (TPR) repeat protein